MNPYVIKELCLTSIKDSWLQTGNSFPDFLSITTSKTKAENEHYIKKHSSHIQKQLERKPRFSLRRKKWKKETLSLIENILLHESILSLHSYIDDLSLNSLQSELSEFLATVRKFAPELDFEGIGQAFRNYIVYAMFKQLNNQKAPLDQACFAYSMLYPFTDNFLDNENYSDLEKLNYNQLIRNKIEGRLIAPVHAHHKKTCQLLQIIEDNYSRDSNSDLYLLLLMMLEAQEKSLNQQNSKYYLSSSKRLDISLYKGGVSVLIDYYFVNSNMTESDLYFYLSFGFFLQLADDLQDIGEDLNNDRQTLFTVDTKPESVEKLVNKMFHFINHIITIYDAPNEKFKALILSSCYQLVFMSVMKSNTYFSKNYLHHFENYFPVTLSFWENEGSYGLEKNIQKPALNYMQILDAMLL